MRWKLGFSLYIGVQGRAMAPAVSRRPVIANGRVQSMVSPCEICGKQSGTVPVPVRSKAYVCGHLPAGVAGSNPTGGMDVCLL